MTTQIDMETLLAGIGGGGNNAALMSLASTFLPKLLGDDGPDIRDQIEKLTRVLKRLKRERALLYERNRTIAFGLGACECWGHDADCARCRGEGAPGYFVPENDEFQEFVAPLLIGQRALIDEWLTHLDAETAPSAAPATVPVSQQQEKENGRL